MEKFFCRNCVGIIQECGGGETFDTGRKLARRVWLFGGAEWAERGEK